MPKHENRDPTKSIQIIIPEIRFSAENCMRIGSSKMEVRAHSLQSRVLRFFCLDPNGLLRREDLIEILHEKDLIQKIATIRFEGSLWQSGHQVMSRLRRTMNLSFLQQMPTGTEWLPYSEILEGWILYKLPGYGSDGGWHP